MHIFYLCQHIYKMRTVLTRTARKPHILKAELRRRCSSWQRTLSANIAEWVWDDGLIC